MNNYKNIFNFQYNNDNEKHNYDLLSRFLYSMKNFGLRREKFISNLIKGQFENILDLGCGDGYMLSLNTDKFKNLYGIDISSNRIEEGKLIYPKLNLIEGDLNQRLNFDDRYFDYIVSAVTIDWVYDISHLLSEVNRVMKDDGYFIFEVNNLGFILRRLQLLLGYYPKVSAFSQDEWYKIGWDAQVCHYFTKRELENFVSKFGFKVEKVTGTGIFYKLRNWWPSLLCGDLIFICKKI